MPLFKKKASTSTPTELLIALSILLTVGLFVLYIKIDLAATGQNADLAIVSSQVDRLQKAVLKLQAAPKAPAAPETKVIDLSTWHDYVSADYSLKYPGYYTVEQPTASFKATVVRGNNGRVEVFKMKDFGGDRPFGMEPENTGVSQQEIDSYVPKQSVTATGTKGTYDVWLFYGKDDAAAKAEVEAIYRSIKVK